MKRALLSPFFTLGLSVLWFAALLPFVSELGSPGNLRNLFESTLPLLVVALGQTAVVLTGGIDLSITSILALVSTTGALLITVGGPLSSMPAVAILLMLLFGAVLGAGNGIAVSLLRMPPFLMTLTGMMLYSGIAAWLTKSTNVPNLPASFNSIGRQFNTAAMVSICCALGAWYLLQRTGFGRGVYATGSNVRTALVSGVPVSGILVAVYSLSGLFAAIAAVLYTGRLETGSPVLGQRILLDVIGAVAIGGTSLFGGRGGVINTVFGVLFMALLDNSLNLLGLSNFGILMSKGFVILGAALLDSARRRYAA